MIPFAYSLPLFVSSIFFVRSFVRYLSLDLSNYCLLTGFTAERYYYISKELFQQYEDIHTRIHIEALSQITMKNPSEATFWSVNTFSVTASALDGNLLLSCFWHFVENIPTCEGYIFQWQRGGGGYYISVMQFSFLRILPKSRILHYFPSQLVCRRRDISNFLNILIV